MSDRLAALEADIATLSRKLAEAEAQRMPHMCRDGHPEIRHADSGDDERCPVCRERDRADAAEARAREAVERDRPLKAALRRIIDLNVQYATDRYGDPRKAETMACVQIARASLSLADPSQSAEGAEKGA